MTSIHLTPGPTEVHPIAKDAIRHALESDICAMSHRSKEFEELLWFTESHLRQLLNIPKQYHVFFLSSGTECWERIIQNGVEKHSFHLVNGAFSKRFYETAKELGKSPTLIDKPLGQGFDMSDISDIGSPELISVTQNETSTGVRLEDGIIESIHQSFPKQLIAVDAVSAAPYAKIDLTAVDYYFFSVQKFFCLPAGLSVLIVSPKAVEKSKELKSKHIVTGTHHSFESLDAFAIKHQTPCTPNVIGIYSLGAMAKYFNDIGIETLRAETSKKATLLYETLDQNQKYKAFVQHKPWRSDTVITIDAGDQLKQMMKRLADNLLIVGEGYGPLKSTQFRVANFAAHSLESFQNLCDLLNR